MTIFQTTFLLAGWLLAGSSGQPSWPQGTHADVGELQRGTTIEHAYKLKNIGTEPLVVETIRTNCGCTVGDYPEQPILPGQTGVIRISYHARNLGYFQQKIKVFLVGQRRAEVLTLEGFVG